MTTPSTTASPILSASPVKKVMSLPSASSLADARRSILEKLRYWVAPNRRRTGEKKEW